MASSRSASARRATSPDLANSNRRSREFVANPSTPGREIAAALAQSCCDLGDEREVIRFLTNNGVSFGDVVTMTDGVIERARVLRQQRMEYVR